MGYKTSVCDDIHHRFLSIDVASEVAVIALNEKERPNCAVVHLSDLLSVSFKIDDDTLELCLYEQ